MESPSRAAISTAASGSSSIASTASGARRRSRCACWSAGRWSRWPPLSWRKAGARSSPQARPNTRPGRNGSGIGRGRTRPIGTSRPSTPSKPSPTGICGCNRLMLVYGDVSHTESSNEKRARILDAVREAVAMTPGVERHGALVAAFIEAGELAQGVADAMFAEHGCDARAQDPAMALLMEAAGIVRLSWESGFRNIVPLAAERSIQLEAALLPESIRVKRPEGYAFYALYPEAYLEAAALGPRRENIRVIGIRSIGTGLAVMVAAALGAPAPATVRPAGHPFRRELALAPELAADLLAQPEARFAVVDEGPGLSGSSFGAVADFLEDHGVAPERIHFFPSHAGDLGPQASPRHRARWAKAPRHIVDFEALVLRARDPAHRLRSTGRGGRAIQPTGLNHGSRSLSVSRRGRWTTSRAARGDGASSRTKPSGRRRTFNRNAASSSCAPRRDPGFLSSLGSGARARASSIARGRFIAPGSRRRWRAIGMVFSSNSGSRRRVRSISKPIAAHSLRS